MPSRPTALLVLALSFPAFAHEDSRDLVIAASTDLRDWCRRESEAQLVGEGETPANWTARHYEKLDTLVVEGRWRVDGETVEVECRAARGARAQFASMKLAPRRALTRTNR